MTPTKDANGDHVCEHGTAMDVHCCNCHSGFIFDKDHECPEPATSSPAPFDFVERLRLAQGQVRSSPLYRKFIDGTPLENDIAVWMTTFAAQAMRDYVQSASATALRACADALAPAPDVARTHSGGLVEIVQLSVEREQRQNIAAIKAEHATGESFEGRVLRAIRNWTPDTPECYAQRSDDERFFYALWVALKTKIKSHRDAS